jgi:hypothetical protein
MAIAGVLLNAWVFAGHTATMVLVPVTIVAGIPVTICQGGDRTLDQNTSSTDKPFTPGKDCPICSGLAVLGLTVLTQHLLLADDLPDYLPAHGLMVARFRDNRPLRTFNRGPPVTA